MGFLELRRGSQPSPWVGPGKPNLPLGLSRGSGARSGRAGAGGQDVPRGSRVRPVGVLPAPLQGSGRPAAGRPPGSAGRAPSSGVVRRGRVEKDGPLTRPRTGSPGGLVAPHPAPQEDCGDAQSPGAVRGETPDSHSVNARTGSRRESTQNTNAQEAGGSRSCSKVAPGSQGVDE